MTYRSPIVLAAVAVLTATSFAQTQRSALGVRIQSTFRAADVNKNGTVSVLEAAKAGIPPVSFAKHDGNKDRRLSSDEFENYYRQLMAVRRQDQAKRVAAKKASTKRRSFKPFTGTTPPTPVVAPTTDAAGGKPAGTRPTQAKPDSSSALPVIPAPPLLDQSKPAPVMPAPATANQKKPSVDSVRKNRNILQAVAVGKRHVKDLQSKGKLSAKDADEMIQVLTLPAPGLSAAESFREWRAALNNARQRIGVLVQNGAMSADEGRQMYLLFEQRAKDAVAWLETGGVTEIKPEPSKAKTPADKAAKGNVDASVKPVNAKPTGPDAGKDAVKKAAAKRALDQQKANDARAKAAAKQAQDRATKDRELKDRQIKARAAKDAQTAKKLPKGATSSTVPKAKTRKPSAVKPKGPSKKPQAKKPAVKSPPKGAKKDSDAKKAVKQDS